MSERAALLPPSPTPSRTRDPLAWRAKMTERGYADGRAGVAYRYPNRYYLSGYRAGCRDRKAA